jgi:hypothetical protein
LIERFPYQDEDVESVLARLIAEQKFLAILAQWSLPRVSRWVPSIAKWVVGNRLKRLVRGVNSIDRFQGLVREFVERLVSSSMVSFEVRGIEHLDKTQGYLFISNHRDIAGDSMLLNLALHRHGLRTVRIAVGDNLVEEAYATDLMRLNKSFFINRTGTNPREVYKDLVAASKYIGDSIDQGYSVWIAQSEGRAKDGRDLTDVSVLKMLHLSDRKASVGEHFGRLNVVATTLSYEFDPLDRAKAREVRLRRETGGYKKSSGEDLKNLALGLTGFKGRVVLTLGPPMTTIPESLEALATQLDEAISRGQSIFPINDWAMRMVESSDLHAALASADEAKGADRVLNCPPEDREDVLKMYAAPLMLKKAEGSFR